MKWLTEIELHLWTASVTLDVNLSYYTLIGIYHLWWIYNAHHLSETRTIKIRNTCSPFPYNTTHCRCMGFFCIYFTLIVQSHVFGEQGNIIIYRQCDNIKLPLSYRIERTPLWYGSNVNLMFFKGFKLIFLMKKLTATPLAFMLIKSELARSDVNREPYAKIPERRIYYPIQKKKKKYLTKL